MSIMLITVYILLKIIWILALMAGYREVSAVKSIKMNIIYVVACMLYLATTANMSFYDITSQPLKIPALLALIILALVSLALNKYYRTKYETYEDTPTIILKKIAALVKNFKEPVNLKKNRKSKDV